MFSNLRKILLLMFIACISKSGISQSFDKDYINVVNERAFKIVRTLNVKDSAKFYLVRDKVARQYINVRILDEKLERQVNEINAKKGKPALWKQELEMINSKNKNERSMLNAEFIRSLSEQLNNQQIDKIKDGLTFGLFHTTYHVFIDMIPSLKAEEEEYIFNALIATRDQAMASGTSKLKETLFEECRAKINSYLKKRGYNLKQERSNWHERMDNVGK